VTAKTPSHVSAREAARRLGISRQAVHQAMLEGRLPHELVGYQRKMVPVAALKAYKPDASRVASGNSRGK